MASNILNFKNYVIISLLSSLGIFIIGLGLSTQISTGLNQLRNAAMGAGMSSNLAGVVTEPLRAAFTGGVPGALIAGFLWPISAVWLILIFLLFFFAAFGRGFSTAAGTITG